MRHRSLFTFPTLVFTLAGVLAATGCEQGQTTFQSLHSPNAPSKGGAVITGTIQPSAATLGASSAGAVVKVVGSDISAVVSANQTFTLTDVPAGNVVLQFSGQGLDSLADLGLIKFADNVVLVITRTNALVRVDFTGRASNGTNVRGRISSLSPTNRSFVVLGQTVLTDPVTQFLRSDNTLGTFFDLFEGLGVQVTSIPGPSGAVIARVVQMEDAGAPPAINLTGTILDVQGTPTSFTFAIRGVIIRGDTSTTFDSGMTFAALRNGVTVDVAGLQRTGFIQATQIRIRTSGGTGR